MRFFVTGVNGQLGHDVMNELHKRGHEGVGSDIVDVYSGVADGSAVTTMPYVFLDITDRYAVLNTVKGYDAVIHCAAWTAVDMAEDDDKVELVRKVNACGTQNIADADQIGTPTYTYDLARLLVDMCETDKYGYYHATNEGGDISWYDFCVEFYKQSGVTTKVIPVTTEEYGLSKAKRPVNSRLDKSKLVEAGFKPLPTWQDAVKRYLDEAKL